MAALKLVKMGWVELHLLLPASILVLPSSMYNTYAMIRTLWIYGYIKKNDLQCSMVFSSPPTNSTIYICLSRTVCQVLADDKVKCTHT